MNGSAEDRLQRAESGGRIGERIARLEERADGHGDSIASLRADREKDRAEIDALKRFQAWIFGIGTGLGAVAAFLANGIRDWLKTS